MRTETNRPAERPISLPIEIVTGLDLVFQRIANQRGVMNTDVIGDARFVQPSPSTELSCIRHLTSRCSEKPKTQYVRLSAVLRPARCLSFVQEGLPAVSDGFVGMRLQCLLTWICGNGAVSGTSAHGRPASWESVRSDSRSRTCSSNESIALHSLTDVASACFARS